MKESEEKHAKLLILSSYGGRLSQVWTFEDWLHFCHCFCVTEHHSWRRAPDKQQELEETSSTDNSRTISARSPRPGSPPTRFSQHCPFWASPMLVTDTQTVFVYFQFKYDQPKEILETFPADRCSDLYYEKPSGTDRLRPPPCQNETAPSGFTGHLEQTSNALKCCFLNAFIALFSCALKGFLSKKFCFFYQEC